ncbi:MAG: hypothetical protein RJR34_00075 [Candidatus Methanoculleus thermohydrogenotrophicum]|nr:hypothetical protein [Candidatus Methanoculleus thermohydrogenotrophicum]
MAFEEACQAEEFYSGIGFVLGDGWLGLDADHVRDPDTGEVGAAPILDEWLKSVQSYAELPPYRAKNKPGFRSFYVFDVCPWDPSHRDRSAFMGQFNHGPLFAGCHHNGCSGNGWTRAGAWWSLEALDEQTGRTEGDAARPEAVTASAPVAAAREDVAGDVAGRRGQPVDLHDRVPKSADNAAKFNALWRGDISGYGSHSEADCLDETKGS